MRFETWYRLDWQKFADSLKGSCVGTLFSVLDSRGSTRTKEMCNVINHLAVCLTTRPKRALRIVRSRASSFRCEYPVLTLRSSSSFLRLLPRLPVTYPSFYVYLNNMLYSRRQFLSKMWPIQLAFRLLISCRIFLCSFTLSNTSSFLTRSVHLIFSIALLLWAITNFWSSDLRF
jgi:hypothetical protein